MSDEKRPQPGELCEHSSHGVVLLVRHHNAKESVYETKSGRHLLHDSLIRRKLGTLAQALTELSEELKTRRRNTMACAAKAAGIHDGAEVEG